MKEVKLISLTLENCEDIPIDRKYVGEFLCNNINEDANVKYACFGQESEDTVFDRLMKCPDIVGVEVVYEDDSRDHLLVPWNEDNDYTNTYQSTCVSKRGRLYLMVSKTRTVQDVLKGQDVDNMVWDWPWS